MRFNITSTIIKKYLIETILIFVFTFSAIMLLTKSLWYDELLTTPLVLGYNIKDMIFELQYDAHPPLYFICLKIYTDIFGHSIITMKIFNIFIELIIIFVSYSHAKKIGNRKYAILVLAIFILFPAIYNEIYQIRMYSFAPLMLLMVGVYANKIFLGNNSKLNQILFIVFSILAIYTHFFAIIGVIFIHFILYTFLFKKNKESIKQISVFLIITTISFIPWIPIFFQQIAIKNDNIGDQSSAISRIVKNIIYLFYTGNYVDRSNITNYLMTILLLLATVFVIIQYLLKDKAKVKIPEFHPVALVAVLIPVIIMSFITTFSILVTPLWYSRYIIIFFPMIAFGFAFFIYNLNKKYLYIYISILSICFTQKIYSTYLATSNKGLTNYSNLIDSKILPNDIILDAGLYEATYFKEIKQYANQSNKSKNLVFNHIYNWNVNLINNYSELLNNRNSFWSPKFKDDSVYVIGNSKFYLKEMHRFEYSYEAKGIISIYKYIR